MVDVARLNAQGENPITQNIYSAIPPEEAILKCHDFNVQTIQTTRPISTSEVYTKTKNRMESVSLQDKREALAKEMYEYFLNGDLTEEAVTLVKSLISEDDK